MDRSRHGVGMDQRGRQGPVIALVELSLRATRPGVGGTSIGEIAFAVLHCTAGDVAIAGLSLLVALVIVGNLAWPTERFIPVMTTTVVTARLGNIPS